MTLSFVSTRVCILTRESAVRTKARVPSLSRNFALSASVTQSKKSFTLNTGAHIPAIGFGTFQDANAQEDTVSLALQKGMRLADTARVYDVEKQVGKGIKKSGVSRNQIFIGTKL